MKLKDLIKESKYLQRKFGEPLPTLDSVMKQHQSKSQVNERITKKKVLWYIQPTLLKQKENWVIDLKN